MILEACVGSVADAVFAQQNGAHQIELCDRLDLDGTTPSTELVCSVLEAIEIPVKVILNPVPFEYRYSVAQLDGIIDTMRQFESLGVSGFVFGALTIDGLPDLQAVERIAAATELPLTFHKAIDQTVDLDQAVRMLVDANLVRFILSSGGKATASEGESALVRMRDLLAESGSEIQLIAAGSITANNLAELHDSLGLTHYHGKKIVG
jgi:copper homeostasis protein